MLGLLLTGEKYFRLNPPLKEMVEIDEIRKDQMEELIRDTRMYNKRNRRLFSDHIDGAAEQSGQGGHGGQGEQEEAGHLMLVLYYILVNRLRLILSSNYCFQIFCFHSFAISL